MRHAQAIDTIRSAEPSLRDLGVVSAALFGSVARGDDTEFSDVDIAVSPRSGGQIEPLQLISVYGVLSEAFGYDTAIDVVVLPSKDPGLNAVIERDSIFAFA